MSFKEWVTITAGVVTVLGYVFTKDSSQQQPPEPLPPPQPLPRTISKIYFEKEFMSLVQNRLAESQEQRVSNLIKQFIQMRDKQELDIGEKDVEEFAKIYIEDTEDSIELSLPESITLECVSNQDDAACVAANPGKLSEYADEIFDKANVQIENMAGEQFNDLLFKYESCITKIHENAEAHDDPSLSADIVNDCLQQHGLSEKELDVFSVK